MSDRELPLPLSYRAELLERLMPALLAGECCSLIGVSGVGKSNLVRFLQRLDVQARYAPAEPMWVVPIDTHSLVFGDQPDEYVVAELMIHRLIREAERRQIARDSIDELDRLHASLLAQPGVHLAIRRLERACGRLCEGQNIRLVFVFDQFEDLLERIDARLFLNLRYLRDEFKYRLALLVITRERIPVVWQRARGDLTAIEAFAELFITHTYGLGMYSSADASVMIDRLMRRSGIDLATSAIGQILALTGHHPGLLGALFWSLHNTTPCAAEPAALLRVSAIADECEKIWRDLTADEQRQIQAIAQGEATVPDRDALADLYQRALINSTPPQLFAPLFTAYVRERNSNAAIPTKDGVVIELGLRNVWVDGRMLPEKLSPLEFKLLTCLARNAGRVCTRDELMHDLYGEAAYTRNDERLDALVRRLREALGDDARAPRYLFVERGVGVRLALGRVEA